MTKTNKLKLLDLFSGIGGFSLGFEMTNKIQTIAFCEKDEFCQKVLAKHWNTIKIYDEIRNLNGKEIRADIITGGFPCQPFSVAGKQKGKDDDRYLWDETFRVITETKPRWFVGENVFGLINIANGTILQQIQKDLESENFQVQCFVLPASSVGAWHERKRIWIIACNVSNAKHNGLYPKKVDATVKSSNKQEVRLSVGSNNNVSNSKTNGIQRLRTLWKQQPSKDVQEEISVCQSQNENKSWWQTQYELCRVPNGLSNELHKDRTNRLKALGNSIVPQVAYEIAKAIIEAETYYENT